ncbi:hypothetical protein K504DRAFT_423187 [Pleomassaria siparia CBS 279.74]|uniref:Uncharacterized protein n=1 Tax=Pleomassaria siparia CBS 279.74 TaxID=1314801 RepID=A0A6G1KJD7_9PLEO|nr:hypothetical protein K504DRAFT_423187 [Pleomassaria siparia CBS 279.74]
MAIIWGLDLREMQWGKFKNSYMWNTEYHRRRTKFIVYQIAMICTVVSESLGTAALSDYVDQQDFVSNLDASVTVHNNDYVGIASYNIFVGIYVATIFGSAFFFDLFWPERHESPAVKTAWRVCSVLACLLTLASALGETVIVASHSAYVTGIDAAEAQRLLAEYGGGPLKYRHNGRAVASCVFEWPGMIATFASTFLLWRSINYIDSHGPRSTSARTRDNTASKPGENGSTAVASPAVPEPTHDKTDTANGPLADANHAPEGV